ncbi:hypothetical protein [Alkalicoccus saliphilus]|uniref:hypothetical protein n=1 Tax=Alkalicoccus saliphilus TaxID=200989 RepID=UPI0014754C47|nr:hypothetical protein [Alkalicoccus saliphilus]
MDEVLERIKEDIERACNNRTEFMLVDRYDLIELINAYEIASGREKRRIITEERW